MKFKMSWVFVGHVHVLVVGENFVQTIQLYQFWG